ncbi:MAG: hypothetical protein NT040_11565 [Bacteroidetes bacterium]|nr:hypothetical protein [Bacteroidota bacterium]
MKTEALNKCLNVITNWRELDDAARNELTTIKHRFGQNFIEPFRRELSENMITQTTNEQNSIIIFYISELNRASSISESYKSIEHRDIDFGELGKLKGIDCKLESDADDWFLTFVHFLFILLYNELQIVCNNYQIPFLEICKERGFALQLVNTEPSLENDQRMHSLSAEKSKKAQVLPDIVPIFTPEYIPQIFDLLKGFFSQPHQDELLKILQTGGNASKCLLFSDSGSRLADAFKQLYDCDIIKGCQKKELENWIGQNFQYRHRDKVTKFTPRYLNDIISSNKDKCQKPILNIKLEKATGNFIISKV